MKRLYFNLSYLFNPRWDTGIPAPEIVRFIKKRAVGKFIDIGCGTGTNLLYMAQHSWQVTGIDYSSNAIRKARMKLRNYGNAFLKEADITSVDVQDFPGPYDLALDMGCFHSIPGDYQGVYVEKISELVRTEGYYLLYAFQPSPDQKKRGITKEDVINLFSQAFVMKKYEQGQGRPSAWYYFKRK
jgi:cyclopropane fatty-acyl-phospholipid synthase-like methyltransferase